MLQKIVLVASISLLPYSLAQTIVLSDKIHSSLCASSEEMLIKYASEQYKNALEKYHDKDSSIDRVVLTLKMVGGRVGETVVKTYFTDYRSKPSMFKEGALDVAPDSFCKLTFKVNADNKVVFVSKDANHRRISRKLVELPQKIWEKA